MSMKKGEKATVTVSAEYLSDKDKFQTTSVNKVLYYEVELVDFVKVWLTLFKANISPI